MSRFGEKLRYLRTHQGISLRDLGEAIGISHTQITRIERGENIPAVTVAYKIARYFGVSLDDLANDEIELN